MECCHKNIQLNIHQTGLFLSCKCLLTCIHVFIDYWLFWHSFRCSTQNLVVYFCTMSIKAFFSILFYFILFYSILFYLKDFMYHMEITYLLCWPCSLSFSISVCVCVCVREREREREIKIFPFTLTAWLNSATDHRGLAWSWRKQGHHEKNMRSQNTDTNVQIFFFLMLVKIWQETHCAFH